jgi:Fe-S cluster biogenesis protein NfuA
MSVEELTAQVVAVLDEVRPHLQNDGGDVELVDVSADGVVKVKLTGACGSCPMAQITLKRGIEARLKEKVPGVTAVEPA